MDFPAGYTRIAYGTIRISAGLEGEKAQVNWLLDPDAAGSPSFTMRILDTCKVVRQRLTAIEAWGIVGDVRRWVRLNRPALLDLWNHGASWSGARTEDFKRTVRRLPSHEAPDRALGERFAEHTRVTLARDVERKGSIIPEGTGGIVMTVHPGLPEYDVDLDLPPYDRPNMARLHADNLAFRWYDPDDPPFGYDTKWRPSSEHRQEMSHRHRLRRQGERMRAALIADAVSQPFPEHSPVVLRRSVENEDVFYPRDTPGVIVLVHETGRDYEVEVFTPRNAVFLLDIDDIGPPPGDLLDE